MQTHQLVLFISKCPEEYTGAKHIEMPEGGGSVGRAPSCTLSLTDHNRFISGTHCLISVYGDTFYISDVSTNGTMVNGNKILKNQPISIVDGDVVSLGQYEIGVELEHISAVQDIAADIAPERVSNDPLVNLGEAVVEEEEKVGALEDLFMETKQDGVNTDDPIAHLKFSMQREDDYLIRDVEKPEPAPAKTIENTRQVVDDSFSIHSEFDIPNLIPEDWLGGVATSKESVEPATEQAKQAAFIPEDFAHTKPVSPQASVVQPDVNQPQQPQYEAPLNHATSNVTQRAEPVSQKWEEVTQAFVPSAQPTQPETKAKEAQQGFVSNESLAIESAAHSSDIGKAFYEGLGISNPDLISNEALLFKQMGACLRLCIDNLQKDLHEVESLKGEQGLSEADSNLAELMLTLNSQNLLSPNELVEQMLDELNDHQIIFNKALNELLIEQSETNDPVTFANDVASKSMFTTKSKLWGEYLEFYANNRRQMNETSLKGLIKKNYTKAIKGSHA
ncbi:TPA: FHA domain-containing protein [Vibrio parahaemolyticus]|uniref:type VI secretion system-associated FHA domain protein n=1 Tax=Vibrio parahaemolyticus TaxID=670 RepID=UPI000FEC9416|nr:FHA domain-containing protein [Vibrio parahaemolyticus]MCX8882364.1 FHA domain-containing protein [Vibrio parahaemolyticus]HAS3028506.1 FHA domain-containing protein [Vibrio parahaemolyticus]HAS3033783.1 FHA domain-containing protein [Vibrio parahaemolyticus]HAS3039366.1 FHA domain-containing protein [Vibrio parahaemolyticus]HAS3044666.1 FHA domain-containing protein [Vibrio parahaemolyticus]